MHDGCVPTLAALFGGATCALPTPGTTFTTPELEDLVAYLESL